MAKRNEKEKKRIIFRVKNDLFKMAALASPMIKLKQKQSNGRDGTVIKHYRHKNQ